MSATQVDRIAINFLSTTVVSTPLAAVVVVDIDRETSRNWPRSRRYPVPDRLGSLRRPAARVARRPLPPCYHAQDFNVFVSCVGAEGGYMEHEPEDMLFRIML